jgi:hypothetical protein
VKILNANFKNDVAAWIVYLKKQALKGCTNLLTSVVKMRFEDLIQAFKGCVKTDDDLSFLRNNP